MHTIYMKMQLQTIQQKIYGVRGQKVMFDFDFAVLYLLLYILLYILLYKGSLYYSRTVTSFISFGISGNRLEPHQILPAILFFAGQVHISFLLLIS